MRHWYDAGDSFDPIKSGSGVADRAGELRLLAGFMFVVEIPKHNYRTCTFQNNIFIGWLGNILFILHLAGKFCIRQ